MAYPGLPKKYENIFMRHSKKVGVPVSRRVVPLQLFFPFPLSFRISDVRGQCFTTFGDILPKEGLHQGLCLSGCVDLNQMMEFEEAMLHKEIRVQRLTEKLEPLGASEILSLVQELKDQVLKLYQESSQKDQLLSDANFKIHMLSMTLTQKDLQLGFCDRLAFEQADRHKS